MSKYDELEKLQNLLKSGALTQEEFEAEKQKIISGEQTSVEQSPDSPHFYCPKCGSSQIETKVFQENSGGTTVTQTKSVIRNRYEKRRIERERHYTDPIITEDELRLARALQLRMRRVTYQEDCAPEDGKGGD